MKKNKPEFWAYFKGQFTSDIEVKCKDGRRFYKHDVLPRFVIAGIALPILLLIVFLDFAEWEIRSIILWVALAILLVIYLPLTYLFAKFDEIEEDDEDKQGLEKIMSESNTEKRDS